MQENNKTECDPHWWRGDKTFGKRICARCGQYEGEEPAPSSTPQSVEGILNKHLAGDGNDGMNIRFSPFDTVYRKKVIAAMTEYGNQLRLIEFEKGVEFGYSQAQKEVEYLKARCEAAEEHITVLFNHPKGKITTATWNKWQALKNKKPE